MYASRLEWNQHELEEHRLEWFCNIPGHEAYRNKEDFTTHMIENHFSSVAIEQLPSLLHSFRRPLDERDTTCPLCLKTPKSIESHLARHHTQLALFAIPRLHYRDDESGNESNTSRRGAGRSSESQSSMKSNSRSASGIKNPNSDVEGEVLEETSTTPPEISQNPVPDDDGFDWKLPSNPDGTEHWLSFQSTTGQQTKDPNPHENGESSIVSMADETLDICFRLSAVLEDVTDPNDIHFATLRRTIMALITASSSIKASCSVQFENLDITSVTAMEQLEESWQSVAKSLHICKTTAEQLDAPIREIYQGKTMNFATDVSGQKILKMKEARVLEFLKSLRYKTYSYHDDD